MPGTRIYELPFTVTDPAGDVSDHLSGDGSGFGPYDLTSVSISEPDSSGWSTVTYTTAGTIDPTTTPFLYTAGFLLVIPSAPGSSGCPFSRRLWKMDWDGESQRADGDDIVTVPASRNWTLLSECAGTDIRTSQSSAPTSRFSFDVNWPPALRNSVVLMNIYAVYNNSSAGINNIDRIFALEGTETRGHYGVRVMIP